VAAASLRLRAAATGWTRRTWAVVGTSVFLVAYVATYARVISPLYVESGMANDLPGDGSLIAAVIAAAAPSICLPLTASRPSSLGLWIVFVGGYVPSILIPPFVLGTGWALAPYWLALSISFMATVVAAGLVRIRVPSVTLSPARYRWLLIGLAIAGAGSAIALFGLPSRLPGLDAVYDVRDEFTQALERAGRFGGYAVWWTGTAIAPLLVAFGAWRRRPLMIAGGFGLFALVYGLAAFRSILFTAVVLVALIMLVRRVPLRLGAVMPVASSVLLFIGVAIAAIGWVIPLSLAVRRLLVVPGQVIAYYYDQFSVGPHYLLSHSVLRWLTDSPFSVPPPVLIGRSYFGQAQNANGNLWADGLANFGLPGLVIASLSLAVILIALDAVARGKPPMVAVTVGGLSLWSVTNSGVLTAFLTHGIALTILLIWVLPSRRQPAGPRDRRVVHISTVHRSDDPRILLKECASLAAEGYDVRLVGRGAPPSQVPPGVTFHTIGDARNRLARMVLLPVRALVRAWRLKAAVYHVHDPELLPVAVLLKLTGGRVLYDAHEDLPRQIEYKPYLPPAARRPVAMIAATLEHVVVRLIDGVVAATPRIGSRFPVNRTTVVQNFPLMSEFEEREIAPIAERPLTVAYIGRLTDVVGAEVMARAVALLDRDDVTFVLAGPVDPSLADRMRQLASPHRLDLPGWVGRDQVADILGRARVGLVLFQPVGNYTEAYPTKLFEYMASGVPAVASNFPVWRTIVADAGAGLLVDPTDAQAVADAIGRLLADDELAATMGMRGRQAVLERFRWDDQAARLLHLYARVLRRPPPRSPHALGAQLTTR
jgi:glycosyltransferase involved in cell wall biosynthesis